jgi:hypothetical protein
MYYVGFSHYAGWQSTKGGRPRCRARGCQKYLRREQQFACSPEHERQAIREREAALAEVKKCDASSTNER